MGYKEALEAAGAEILECTGEGDYSGILHFLCRYESKIIVVDIWYGSCTVCDAFQNEFYGTKSWTWDKDPEQYQQALKDFGLGYLKSPVPLSVAIEKAKKDGDETVYWFSGDESTLERLERWATKYPVLLQ